MTTLRLPLQLQARLDALPAGLQAHISRVREIARALAETHGIDGALADRGMMSFSENLTAAEAEAMRSYVVSQAHVAQ